MSPRPTLAALIHFTVALIDMHPIDQEALGIASQDNTALVMASGHKPPTEKFRIRYYGRSKGVFLMFGAGFAPFCSVSRPFARLTWLYLAPSTYQVMSPLVVRSARVNGKNVPAQVIGTSNSADMNVRQMSPIGRQ